MNGLYFGFVPSISYWFVADGVVWFIEGSRSACFSANLGDVTEVGAVREFHSLLWFFRAIGMVLWDFVADAEADDTRYVYHGRGIASRTDQFCFAVVELGNVWCSVLFSVFLARFVAGLGITSFCFGVRYFSSVVWWADAFYGLLVWS